MPQGSYELIGIVLGALTPFVGAFIWLTKWMAQRLTTSIDRLNDTIAHHTALVTRHVEGAKRYSSRTRDDIRDVRERQDATREVLDELVRRHAPGHKLCRFNDVEADQVKRAARATLKKET